MNAVNVPAGREKRRKSPRLIAALSVGSSDRPKILTRPASTSQIEKRASPTWRRRSPAPSPRSGHAGDALDTKRVLVFGGQGANGALCSDLWALKDVDFDEAIDAAELLLDGIETGFSEKRKEIVDVDEKKEEKRTSPVWTRLFLKGAAPSPRTGHSVTKFGSKILVWGGQSLVSIKILKKTY